MFSKRCRLVLWLTLISIIIYFYTSYITIHHHSQWSNRINFHPAGNRSFSSDYLPLLDALDLINPTERFTSTDHVVASTPVFVSAWTRDFHQQGEMLCASLIAYTGIKNVDKRLIVYNLSLSDEQINDYRSKCPIVQFRTFNFTPYPKYIRYWNEFRWKPILIADALLEFPSIWWLDSSIIFGTNDSLQKIYTEMQLNIDDRLHFAMIGKTSHSIYAATDARMYAFLPISINYAKHTEMYQASYMLWYSTRSTRNDLLKWLVWCAIEYDCMAPIESKLQCQFDSNDRYSINAKCHRYDQSAVNIIAAMVADYDTKRYLIERSPMITSRIFGG